MNNFNFLCPTRVIFGKNSIKNLSTLLPKNKKILMIYGGGSIKKNGVYDDVIKEMKNFNFIEFSGIEPNPKFETCMKAVEIVKQENIKFLLSVGGGSVLDATKFIAAASKFKGKDAWDIVLRRVEIKNSVSIGSIMTLPATGSEMNGFSVISHQEKQEKFGWFSELSYPKFSIIDPCYTYSLSKRQTINGIIDTFAHIMEQYCTFDVDTPIQDGFCFSILKTLLSQSAKVITNPTDYNARANIFWAATCGLNGWCSVGVVQDWSTHAIGHELSAIYGLDHGQSLAIVLPRLLRYNIDYKKQKLEKLGCEVFNLNKNEKKLAEKTICEIEKFFKNIGAKLDLKDYGINSSEAAEKIYDRFKIRGVKLGEKANINADAAKEILLQC